MTTLSPSLIGTPRISVSRVAVRRKLWIDAPQRSISSTPESQSDGSSRRRCAWSGWSIRASIEWLMRFRVVSLPATISVMKKRLSSASLSRSPSISAFTSSVMMSSRGLARRSAATSSHIMYTSIAAAFGPPSSSW